MSPEEPGAVPTVLVSNRQDMPVDEVELAYLARRCLEGEGMTAAELSVSFVTEDEMAKLHERYMGEPGPTDVLSFGMDEDVNEDGVRILGDVVIAPAVAAQADQDLEAELRLLVVHGILHLLGFDHEDELSKARMWKHQAQYLGAS